MRDLPDFVQQEQGFEQRHFVLTPDHVRFDLENRTPPLPRWYLEGTMRLYGLAEFEEAGMTILDSVLPAAFSEVTQRHQMVMAVESASIARWDKAVRFISPYPPIAAKKKSPLPKTER